MTGFSVCFKSSVLLKSISGNSKGSSDILYDSCGIDILIKNCSADICNLDEAKSKAL